MADLANSIREDLNPDPEVIKDPEIEGLVMKKTNGLFKISRTSGLDSRWMYKVRRPNKNYRR